MIMDPLSEVLRFKLEGDAKILQVKESECKVSVRSEISGCEK